MKKRITWKWIARAYWEMENLRHLHPKLELPMTHPKARNLDALWRKFKRKHPTGYKYAWGIRLPSGTPDRFMLARYSNPRHYQ
jgi:hypothetical protein